MPKGSSAIVLLADAGHVDAMLDVLGESKGEVVRRTLTSAEEQSLIASVSATPAASAGPSDAGDAAA